MNGAPPFFESIRVMNPGLKRPSGPVRAGLLAAVIAGAVPLVAALLLALIAGVLVYAVVTAVSRVLTTVGLQSNAESNPVDTAPEPERENVRVRR